MKKIISLIIVATLAFSGLQKTTAQHFSQGDKVINLGLGLGSALYGVGYKMTIPPISASFELGIKDDVASGNIGVGGYLGIAGSKWENSYFGTSWGYKYTYIVIGVRGAYHFQDIADQLDLYGGLMPYFSISSSSPIGNTTGYSPKGSFMSVAFYGGARYYFTDNIAGMAELGWGVSYLNIGVAFKL